MSRLFVLDLPQSFASDQGQLKSTAFKAEACLDTLFAYEMLELACVLIIRAQSIVDVVACMSACKKMQMLAMIDSPLYLYVDGLRSEIDHAPIQSLGQYECIDGEGVKKHLRQSQTIRQY